MRPSTPLAAAVLVVAALVGAGCGEDAAPAGDAALPLDAASHDAGVASRDARASDATAPDGALAPDAGAADAATPGPLVLGISGRHFTVDGTETFLLGVSYFGGVAASEATVRADFDALAAARVNHVRVFAAWGRPSAAAAVLRPDGSVDAAALARLTTLVDLAREHGIVVDVTFARGIVGVSDGTFSAYRDGIALAASALRDRRNVSFDLGNEHDVADARELTPDEVRELAAVVRAADPARLMTASLGGNDPDPAAALYVPLFTDAELDFAAPHFPRTDDWAAATQGRVEAMRAALVAAGFDRPIHLQEENRRGYTGRDLTKDELLLAAAGARAADAAAWNLHTQAGFDLSSASLFEQLDPVELDTIDELATAVGR